MKKADEQTQFDLGKDEMNLLEYSVFSSSTKVDRKTSCVEFTKEVWCKQKRRPVKRQLTMAFNAKYGRPTTRDDQLYVALLKKTADLEFRSQTVHFTRYELLQILGWSEKGVNYQRIDDGFNRICGAFLNWQNAYWDKAERSWVDRKFHIIDDVKLYDREKFNEARVEQGVARPQSWFKWSDVLFDSFQSGYIKSLNMDIFRDLEHDMAKKIYRFVDKRFNDVNRPGPVELPLEEFAVQKLGFRRAAPAKLRDMLIRPIDELVAKGHLRAMAVEKRFPSVDGVRCIRLERPRAQKGKSLAESPGIPTVQRDLFSSSQPKVSPLAAKLIALGMTQSTAVRWAEKEPEESARQIEFFDFKKSKGWKPESSSGGYLNRAIKERFSSPDGFKTKAERDELAARREKARRDKAAKDREQEERVQRERTELKKKEEQVLRVQKSIPETRLIELEEEALQSSDSFTAKYIREDRRKGKLSMVRIEFWHEHIIPKYFAEE